MDPRSLPFLKRHESLTLPPLGKHPYAGKCDHYHKVETTGVSSVLTPPPSPMPSRDEEKKAQGFDFAVGKGGNSEEAEGTAEDFRSRTNKSDTAKSPPGSPVAPPKPGATAATAAAVESVSPGVFSRLDAVVAREKTRLPPPKPSDAASPPQGSSLSINIPGRTLFRKPSVEVDSAKEHNVAGGPEEPEVFKADTSPKQEGQSQSQVIPVSGR